MVERTSASAPSASGTVTIDGTGILLPDDVESILDLVIEAQPVWTFKPGRDGRSAAGGRRLVPWPDGLRKYLTGTGHVVISERFGTEVLFDAEHEFDASDGRTSIRDRQGRALFVNKHGNLLNGFGARGQEAAHALVAGILDVLERLHREGGVDAFLAYGSLLGAVREGRFIAHDTDADIAYLSKRRTLTGVIQESYEVERIARRTGLATIRRSAGTFSIALSDSEGWRMLDVFTGFVLDDVFYLMPEVHAPYRSDLILPLGEVELEGRKVVAPADPEGLLEITYGPSWRVPDPSFKFETPTRVQRRLTGWMRGNSLNRNHWTPFYSGKSSSSVPEQPSPFAQWVVQREPDTGLVVDIGAGTGRDSLWFARQGRDVLGLDYVAAATDRAGNTAREQHLPARFRTFNLYDTRQVLSTGGELAHRDEPPTLYGRFLLHAVEDRGRHNLWRMARMCLRRGGRFYLEFRTGADAGAEHEFGEHFRKYLDPDQVSAEIEAAGGQVEYREQGYGLAVYKDEDPHVCRLVATWKS